MANDVAITIPIFSALSKGYKGSVPKCIVINTTNNSVSEYLNYPFNSYARFNGVNLAANQAGIFTTNTTDLDEAAYKIKLSIKTGKKDIYDQTISRLRDAYIAYKSDGDIKLSTVADKKVTREYLIPEQTDGVNKTLKKRRVKFERGIRNRYFDFKLENINGSELEFESLKIFTEPINSKRR